MEYLHKILQFGLKQVSQYNNKKTQKNHNIIGTCTLFKDPNRSFFVLLACKN